MEPTKRQQQIMESQGMTAKLAAIQQHADDFDEPMGVALDCDTFAELAKEGQSDRKSLLTIIDALLTERERPTDAGTVSVSPPVLSEQLGRSVNISAVGRLEARTVEVINSFVKQGYLTTEQAERAGSLKNALFDQLLKPLPVRGAALQPGASVASSLTSSQVFWLRHIASLESTDAPLYDHEINRDDTTRTDELIAAGLVEAVALPLLCDGCDPEYLYIATPAGLAALDGAVTSDDGRGGSAR